MNALLVDAHGVPALGAAAGGKATQLARLRLCGLPVPDFLVIPAGWLAAGPSSAQAEELRDALVRRGWLDRPLAVRSSATGEDGATASYAGIYRSHLNVIGVTALMDAIADVRASLDGEAARAYRQRIGAHAPVAMAVIVMPLVAAEASGIAFTCDPVSGREDRLIVHANWGLGESLVGGEAAGDEYVFAEDATDTFRRVACRPGGKALMRAPVATGGTAAIPVPTSRAAKRVFDDARAETLAALLRDAALALDFVAPFHDLEWCWDGAQFWLLQARPVTRRPYLTYSALQSQPILWTRGNTCEIMPEPLQPMDWNFSRRGVNALLEQGWRLVGYPLKPGVQRAALFHGRLYLEASLLQWEAWDAMGITPERFNALLGGHQPAIVVDLPTPRQRLQRLTRMLRYALLAPARRRRGEQAIARVRTAARHALRATPPHDAQGWKMRLLELCRPAREEFDLFFLQGAGGGSLALLVEQLEQAFPGEGQALGAALLAGGEPSVTARQGYDLLALARVAAACAGSPQDDPAFACAFAAFLDEYGHRGHYETYIRSPRWRENPERILEQLPALASVDEAALRARQHAGAQAAWRRIRMALPMWKRRFLKALVAAATRESNQREAARSALVANLEAVRNAWLGAAAWMCDQGWLHTPDEIFWLCPSEVLCANDGLIRPEGLQARIEARKRQFAQWQTETPPEFKVITPAAPRHGGAAADAVTARSVAPHGRWRGIATGTGHARGTARILRHPAEGARLQVGDILVAPSTDPGWTPLFLKAAGLIVETGGYLSHGAIVAREFALPAVVNLPGILDAIADGDQVEVDGLSGEVRRVGG